MNKMGELDEIKRKIDGIREDHKAILKGQEEQRDKTSLFKIFEKDVIRKDFKYKWTARSGLEVKPSWKDLRSSMACDLLKKGWSRDEINARLGHRPSSRIIDRYINYLAIDRKKPKKKIYEGNIEKLEAELSMHKEISKLQNRRIERQQKEMEEIKKEIKRRMDELIISTSYVTPPILLLWVFMCYF